MGVPKFYKWLSKTYNDSFISYSIEHNINWLLLDANGLVHPICNKTLEDETNNNNNNNINNFKLEEIMINNIIKYFDYLLILYKPNGLFIAFDGPVGLSKMKQQRQRRYKTIYDNKLFDNIKKKYNKPLKYFWNNSAISPGTLFMKKLNDKIIEWINNNNNNINVNIVYSNSNIIQEGEHKILNFIKNNYHIDQTIYTLCSLNNNINNNKINCDVICGLDADLIFLMLSLHKQNIYLLRENEFVNIDIMKKCICDTFKLKIDNINISLNNNRLINDFIFLCFFLGNDFLPHLYALDISNKGIELILNIYSIIFNQINNNENENILYLIDENKTDINLIFLNHFINILSTYENDILLNKKKYYYENCFSNDLYDIEINKINNLMFNINNKFINHSGQYLLSHSDNKLNFYKNINYKQDYYKHYFNTDNENEINIKKNTLVNDYITGLKWILLYYFNGIPDWYWFYKYDYPPLIQDINECINNTNINNITFNINIPFTPIEQLLFILPPQSFYLLPKNINNIILKELYNKDENNIYKKMYPFNIKIDYTNKNKYYEGIPILPIFNISFVQNILKNKIIHK